MPLNLSTKAEVYPFVGQLYLFLGAVYLFAGIPSAFRQSVHFRLCQDKIFFSKSFQSGVADCSELLQTEAGGGQPPRTGQELSTRFFKRCAQGFSRPCGVRNLVCNRQALACEKPCGQLRSISSAQYFIKNTCNFHAVVYNKARKGAADERFLPM